MNYESAHVNLHTPDSYSPENTGELKPKIRRAEVRLAPNHKASTQFKGDITYLEHAIDMFHRSPKSDIADTVGQPVNMNYLAMKWAGTHGDHAEDQKAKCRLLEEFKKEGTEKALGERELYSMPESDRLDVLESIGRAAIASAGGLQVWGSLDPLIQQRYYEDVMEHSLRALAADAKLKLDEDELKAATVFLWVGCQMHKDLNAVKGGCQAMKEEWAKIGVGPCPLANKDNAAILQAAAQGQSVGADAVEHANAVTSGGAVKLCELAGALLNHKDNKKGYHDAFRDYAKLILGLTFTFPDTSNTRFGSYLDAAAELISKLNFYLKFIEHIRNCKEKRNLNNVETNVKRALEDIPTIVEMAVLTLYREVISHPYITTVRGSGLEEKNALEMGPFHRQVADHICKLIEDPELVLSPSAEPSQAILGAYTHWKSPDAVKAVHDLVPQLPYIREIFVSFLRGALKTWKRFSAEFAPDGEIKQLTEIEKKKFWMPTTNDANEGVLGEWRSFSRRYPCGSLSLFNAISTFRHNNTQDFMDHVLKSSEDQAFLRGEGRTRVDGRSDANKRKLVAEEMVVESEAKRLKGENNAVKKRLRTEHLANLQLVTDGAELAKMTTNELKDQLAKYKAIDKIAKAQTYIRKKDDLLRVVSEAAERYLRLDPGD